MRIVNVSTGPSITGFTIGRRGENKATNVVFDLTDLIDNFGEGIAILVVKRPGETDPYPISLIRDGSSATWEVTNTDTANVETMMAELFWYQGEMLAKSILYTVRIGKDIGDESFTPPDPYDSWIESLTNIAVIAHQEALAAESAKNAIENMTVTATTLPAGRSATVSKTSVLGRVNLAFGIPQGIKGDTGRGFPSGGKKGQVLVKKSDVNYDTEWVGFSEYLSRYGGGS